MKTGVRQGCVLSPMLFNCFMDRILKEVVETLGGGLQVEYTIAGGLFLMYRDRTKASALIQDILCADDLTLAAESRSELKHMLDILDRACRHWGMIINVGKTKVLSTGDHLEADQAPTLQNRVLEDVKSFSYLESEVEQTRKVEKEVTTSIQKAGTVYQMWRRKVFRSRTLGRDTKMRAFRTLVMSVLLYGAKTWPVTK